MRRLDEKKLPSELPTTRSSKVLGNQRFLNSQLGPPGNTMSKIFKYVFDSFGKMQMGCDWEVVSAKLSESMIEALHDESDIGLVVNYSLKTRSKARAFLLVSSKRQAAWGSFVPISIPDSFNTRHCCRFIN